MTYHSILRTEERANLTRESSIKMIIRAQERGRGAENYPSKEREYLNQKSKNGLRAVVYADYCFIFSESDKCITMYHLPAWFGKKGKYDGKNEIRNIKRYVRYNKLFDLCGEKYFRRVNER